MDSITITISPGSFGRARNDPEFREEIFRRVDASSVEEEVSAQDFIPNDLFPEQEATGTWVDAAVKLMLSLVAELRPKVGKSFALKTKSKMWKAIEVKLRDHFYNFTALQIENKFRGLERTFKKVKSHNNKSGRHRECCPYEKELGEILNGRVSVFPDTLLGTARVDVLRREELLELGNVSLDAEMATTSHSFERRSLSPGPSPSGPSPSGPSPSGPSPSGPSPSGPERRTKICGVQRELQLLREERQTQHAEIVSILKQNAADKNLIMQERNDILRDFMNSLLNQ